MTVSVQFQVANGKYLYDVQDEARLQQAAQQAEAVDKQLQQATADLQQCQQDLEVATAASTSTAQHGRAAAEQIKALKSELAAQQERSKAALQALQQELEDSKQNAQQAQQAEVQQLQDAVEAGRKSVAELQQQVVSQHRAEEERDDSQTKLRSASQQLSIAQQAASRLEDTLADVRQEQAANLNELQQAKHDLIGVKADLDLAKQQAQAAAARQQEAFAQGAKVLEMERSLAEKLNELHALQQQLVEKGVQLQVCMASSLSVWLACWDGHTTADHRRWPP